MQPGAFIHDQVDIDIPQPSPVLAGATAGAATLMLGLAATASAHVTVTPGEATADSYAVLTFGVPHGCDGSATTEVAIQVPEEITSVTPTVNPNWTVHTVTAERVVYTAITPLPDGLRDTFELSIRLPGLPGETLAFPIVRRVRRGRSPGRRWPRTVLMRTTSIIRPRCCISPTPQNPVPTNP